MGLHVQVAEPTIDRHKARLVAKGYILTYGLDPVVKATTASRCESYKRRRDGSSTN